MNGALRLLPAPAPRQDGPQVVFCGYCARAATAAPDAPVARICSDCGLGMMLTADAALAPSAGQATLVVDRSLSVCAMSRAAEALLGLQEPAAVNRHLSELLTPAHAEATGLASLVAVVVGAAGGDAMVRRTVVRPAGEFGVRYAMRVGACGPPRAALLVLDDTEV